METVWVGMSGGVDSSVAALLLKKQGYRVVGVTLKLRSLLSNGNREAMDRDVQDARKVCEVLGIEHRVYDFSKTFCDIVVENYVTQYRSGKTPNPCIVCNRTVKFGLLLETALENGADKIASGHYADCYYNKELDRWQLRHTGSSKDQTYVLYGLSQHQLSHILFPLSGMSKDQVRKLAEENHLPIAHKADSMEACFVPAAGHMAFIEEYTGKKSVPGDFVSEQGDFLGKHQGIGKYTIGQRKGLGVTFGKPMYVIGIDAENHRVVLGEEGKQMASELTACDVNYLSILKPSEPIRVEAKIRYQAAPAPATMYPLDDDCIRIVFDSPQRSVTPGQAVVLYDGNVLLGGGTIQ